MRSLITRNKRIKVIVHQKLSEKDSWDETCMEFTEIDRSELIFSRPTNLSTLDKVDSVEIYFKISGKWKNYIINNLSPIFDYADQSVIQRVSFNFEKKEQNDFDQSFRIARCC